MNRRDFITAATLGAAILPPPRAFARVYEYGSGPSSTTRFIATKMQLTEPHFYYVAGSISVFIPPDFVSQHGHAYVPIVMSAAPLRDHTDILRGFVLGNNHPLDVLFIVADALESGVTLVHDMNRGATVSQIKLVMVNDGNSGSRSFFLGDEYGGDKIFHVLDWIS